MQDSVIYLFVGFLVTWLIMGAYLLSLRRQVDTVREELDALRRERQATLYSSVPSADSLDASRLATPEEG
jgi:CcmD family protein